MALDQTVHRLRDLSIRLLLVGGKPASELHIPGVAITTSMEGSFDCVAALQDSDDTLFDRLYRSRRLLYPILDFSEQGLSRADYRARMPTGEELVCGLASVCDMLGRVRSLPEIVRDGDALTALALAHTREVPIAAAWRPMQPEGAAYPLMMGIPAARDLLEELAGQGLLSRVFFDRVHVCSRCPSSRLNVREECPSCSSSNLKEESLIHHYRCANLARESLFMQGRELICPKCRKELRHYAVDYDRPGLTFLCRSCGNSASEPNVGFVCMDCGGHTSGEAAELRSWYHYELTPAGVAAVESGFLPHLTLDSLIGGKTGAYSWRDFRMLLRFQWAVVSHYERNAMGVAMTVVNRDAVQAKLGGWGLSRALALLTEILSQNLRQCDAVTAAEDTLYLLLPETEPHHTEILLARFKDAVRSRFAVDLKLNVDMYCGTELAAFVDRVTA